DLFSECAALRGVALTRSFEGDHKRSLADLERLFRVMRSFATSLPSDYCDYLNNLAYELGQVGRIDEARAAINVALRSPNADRFPDWAETARELDTMQRRLFLPLVFVIGGSTRFNDELEATKLVCADAEAEESQASTPAEVTQAPAQWCEESR